MKLFTVLLFTLSLGYFNAQDKIDAKIIELLEITNSTKQFNLAIDNMIDIQKKAFKESSDSEKAIKQNESFFDDFRKEIKKDGINDLYAMLIPIYKKHMTEEELDGIITFYKSSAGQSYLKKSPLIMTESMQAGSEWGGKIAAKIVEKLKQEKK